MRHNFTPATKRAAKARANGRCEAMGCDKDVFRRGLCSMHLSRLKRHGALDAAGGKHANGAALDWVQAHISHKGEACLIYTPVRGKVTMPNGRRVMVHQAMCELAHGPKPTPDHEVAHGCGKGHLGCANPEHLRWATHTDNMADRIVHGTANRGERHGHSKLTSDDVRRIRARVAAGETQAAVACDMGTQQSTVGKIVRGERWGWLDDQI